MIEVLHVAGGHHRYGGLTALDAVEMTVRAGDVLRIAAEGLPNSEIAARLRLAEGTVRNYLSTAITELGARNRIEAARAAPDRGRL
ncbi:MAG TPA: helix-turn-helix transcriptional regulator [Pseudonocardia sp.]